MNQYLDILTEVLDPIKEGKGLLKTQFTTSADVVMKASGLRFEAIRVIAREQGVEIEDTTCRCIDENLLVALADAHVRRMRTYFINVRRHVAELDGDELAIFLDFCRTFNNRQSSDPIAQRWSDIDTDAIREQFIQRVHELTPSSWPELFNGCALIFGNCCDSLSFGLYDNLRSYEDKLCGDVVERVLHSCLYYEKPQKTKHPCIDIREIVRRVTLFARYHLFTSEDDHQQDAINNHIINRAPVMVA